MSSFWKHYEAAKPGIADAVDDVRHKLVEEAWFGKQVTGEISEAEAPEPVTEEEPTPSVTPGASRSDAIYEGVWGKAPTHAEIYGQASGRGGAPAIEAPTQQEAGPGPEI